MAATLNDEGDFIDTESISKTEKKKNQPGAVQKNGRQNKEVKI